jgi:hypothetical protein
LRNNLDPVCAVDVPASGGGGDAILITKVTQGGVASINSPSTLSVALGGMVVAVAFKVATLASNKPRAVVIGRRQRSNKSAMVEVLCDAVPMAHLLMRIIAPSTFAPKIINVNIMVDAMVMLRLRIKWIVVVNLGNIALTTQSGISAMVLLQATTAAKLDIIVGMSWVNMAWMDAYSIAISCLCARSTNASNPLSYWMLLVVLRAYWRRSNELAPRLSSLAVVSTPIKSPSLPVVTPVVVGSGRLVLSSVSSEANGLGDAMGWSMTVWVCCTARMSLRVTGAPWE